MDQLAAAVATIGQEYMWEVGILGGGGALFSAIVFGFCDRQNRFRAFSVIPRLEAEGPQVDVSEQDLDRPLGSASQMPRPPCQPLRYWNVPDTLMRMALSSVQPAWERSTKEIAHKSNGAMSIPSPG